MLLFVFALLLPWPVHALMCFQCSGFEGSLECPVSTTDPTLWVKNSGKYQFVGKTGEFSCAVGYSGGSGKVYYQVSLD